MNIKLFSLVVIVVLLSSMITFSNHLNPRVLHLDFYTARASSEQSESPTKSAIEQQEISVAIKQKKHVTLLAVKNNGHESMFGFKIRITDGNIKFVKARGWDRGKIDSMTVLVKTVDEPIKPGKSMVILVLTDSQNPSYEWSAFSKDNTSLAEGNLTVSESSRPALGQLNFAVKEYQMPNNSSYPVLPLYDQNRKVVWISDASKPRVWSFNLETREFKTYEYEGKSASRIAIDNNQRVWFIDNIAKSFGYIEPEKDSSKIFKLPVDGFLIAITVDPKDNVWIAVIDKDRIVSFNPNTEEFRVFEATAQSGPSALLIDKSGIVWFTEGSVGKLGKLDPITGKIVEYQPPDGKLVAPTSIIQDSRGFIWIGEHGGHTVTRFDPVTLNFQRFPIPDKDALTLGMVEDRYGNIWYAEHEPQYIAVLDPRTGETKEIRVPSATPSVLWLTIDGDGRVWFAEPNNAKIGSITISTMSAK